MKYNFMLNMFGKFLGSRIKQDISDKNTQKSIKQEYKEIMLRAEDIGADNMLLSSYAMAGFFIAMNRKDGLTPEKNYEIFEKGILRSEKFVKMFLGSADDYLSEKKMEARRKWSEKTHERKYKNDWVVDVIEKSNDYAFGLDYYECGVCKLCRDENCFGLAKYLCRLDFLLVEIIGIKLDRTMTLADGCEKCDFRFKR